MNKTLHLTTTVLPGGKIEIADPSLPVGELVRLVVMPGAMQRRSALDILAEAPGRRLFKTAADVESYLDAERSAWTS